METPFPEVIRKRGSISFIQNRHPLLISSNKVPKIIGRNDVCNCGSGKKYKKCCQFKVDTTATQEIIKLPGFENSCGPVGGDML